MQCDVLPNFSISSTLKKFNLKSKPGGLDLSWRGLHRDSWSRHCQDVSLDARENLNSFKKLVSTMYNLNRFQKLILTVETPRLNEMSTIYNIDGRHFRFRDFGSERWCRGKINISWSQWRLLDCWDFSIVETSRLSRLLDCRDFLIVETSFLKLLRFSQPLKLSFCQCLNWESRSRPRRDKLRPPGLGSQPFQGLRQT